MRGVGRTRKRELETSEFWREMGQDELLSGAPELAKYQNMEEESVLGGSVEASRSCPDIVKMPSKEEIRKAKTSSAHSIIGVRENSNVTKKAPLSLKELELGKNSTYKQFVKNLKMELNPQVVTKDNQYLKVNNAVAMLTHLPYEEQLHLKQKKNSDVIEVLKNSSKGSSRVSSCKKGTIIGAHVREQYRCKDEFSVHLDIEGQLTVGFFVGGGSTGVVCVEPREVQVVKESHKKVAAAYQTIIRGSKLPPDLDLGPRLGGAPGVWGSLLVKSNQRGDLMARVSLCGSQLENGQLQCAREEILRGFCNMELHSLYIEYHGNCGNIKRSELLHGEPYIEENLLGRKILLGPDSFFQGHHAMAAILAKVVRSKLKPKGPATLLDLCCGVGNFSLQLAENFRDCIGVDITDTSLAVKNASINGLQNCEFVTGKVVNVISALVKNVRSTGAEVVAVVNPGRGGVDREVVEQLRSLPLLSSLVYVSCEPEDRQVVNNLISLVKQEKKGKTEPFTLTEAIPIDMFPNTHHCEHVFVFRRKN